MQQSSNIHCSEIVMSKPKASTLASVWSRPDHSVLMPKQISIRLPALVAAKLAAICEMFPGRSRSEIINDLIATALGDFKSGLEWAGVGAPTDRIDGEDLYQDYEGTGPTFAQFCVKHTALIEKELGVSLSTPGAKSDPD